MISLRVRKTARGGKMVTAVLDDRTARIEMTIFDDVNEQYGHLLAEGQAADRRRHGVVGRLQRFV